MIQINFVINNYGIQGNDWMVQLVVGITIAVVSPLILARIRKSRKKLTRHLV